MGARFTPREAQASRDGIELASLELDGAELAAMDVLRTGAGMDFLARLDRGRSLGNASRDAFAGSAGAIVMRAAAVDRPALVAGGRGLIAPAAGGHPPPAGHPSDSSATGAGVGGGVGAGGAAVA